jgi:hypothetical protein
MAPTENSNASWKFTLTSACLVALVGLPMAAAEAADTPGERLDRKVQVMERVIDEILVQSDNVTVGPGNATRGIVLDEFGALFTFDAMVGVEHLAGPRWLSVRVSREDDERPFVWVPDSSDLPKPGEDLEKHEAKLRELNEKVEQKQKEHYAAFKTELIDALVDYGGTLTELKDDQWIALLAFLDDNRLFGADSGTRLMVKVRARDLRQYSAGSLSRDAVAKRVIVEER